MLWGEGERGVAVRDDVLPSPPGEGDKKGAGGEPLVPLWPEAVCAAAEFGAALDMAATQRRGKRVQRLRHAS